MTNKEIKEKLKVLTTRYYEKGFDVGYMEACENAIYIIEAKTLNTRNAPCNKILFEIQGEIRKVFDDFRNENKIQ